jgi:hypothetical protein
MPFGSAAEGRRSRAKLLDKAQEPKMSEEKEKGPDSRRRFERKYTLFKIPVYDAQTRRFLGLVQDLSENGIQLLGVNVEVNSTKTMIIQASDYIKGTPISFDAVCRWVRKEDPLGYYVSGFEITEITPDTKKNLIGLMQYITLG